ncbi:DNA mismatch repair protein MSH5 isoform X2 [Selaginella moellendorffii]|nr:DNA mismatch repair protein MSH5 isoform X2 [Selaginella moellendorffii]|eukprot:XP_002967541.2 DNA mismatch repair protein MSH5 isoform X2 [Selaginella moellendorffii]
MEPEGGEGEAAEEQEEDQAQVYMTCILQGNRLGAAYYELDSATLYVMDAWEEENADYPCVQLVKFQAQPAIIYTSTKMEESFIGSLRKQVDEETQGAEVKLVKSSYFSYEQAWHRLMQLQLRGMHRDLPQKERIHYLNTLMNLESEMQVRAAGALIAILQQELMPESSDAEDGVSRLRIFNVSELSLNGFLNLDATTYDALQVFQVDKHPSHMGIGKPKEGFSVFGMMNKCVTLMGRRLLRTWFSRPILDWAALNDRLDTVSFVGLRFLESLTEKKISVLKSSHDLTQLLQNTMKQVKSIPRLLQKFASPSFLSSRTDWSTFLKSINALIEIRQTLAAFLSSRQDRVQISNLEIFQKVFSTVTEDFAYVSDLVKGVLDFDQTCGEACDTFVARGICQELDELKAIYDGLPQFLDEIASSEIKKLPHQRQGSIVYIPQVGYLMCFPGELKPEVLEIAPDFQLAFKSGCGNDEEFFYHTTKTRELDEVLGDIYYKILDMERAILKELESKVQKYEPAVRYSADLTAQLDCLVSMAISAGEYNYNRPRLVEDDILIIKNGRHPLQELTVDTFVPNNTQIEEKGRICVVTGPNYSGKSVYIKQVALIVFLSHIGSFVPADEAVIGITDRIFTRLPCKQSTKVPQSTFMTDLHQISVMLRYATSKSLCLIDEFGSGTMSADGIGLLCSTLHHFAGSESSPKILACTHFSELSEGCFLPKSQRIAFYTMSILEPTGNNGDPNRLADIVFLYRLVPGYQAPSYGLHCAELAGVPHEIINRAAEILESMKMGKPIHRLQVPKIVARDREYQELVDQLVAFDCKNGDVNKFLHELLSF